MPIKQQLAIDSLKEKVANPLKTSAEEAAWSVFVVACANMMRAVKAVSTYRGRDPRDCALMAFGGNGGIFAVELARQLQMKTVLVPPVAGVFSAYGLGVAQVEYSQTQGYLRRLADTTPGELEAIVKGLRQAVLDKLGYPEASVHFAVLGAVRYVGQAFELRVPLSASIREDFEREHEKTYGHRMETGSDVEFVALEVIGTIRDQRADASAVPQKTRKGSSGKRKAYFGPEVGWKEAAVIGRESLTGKSAAGPLVIEEYEGTTVVPPGASASLDEHGNIVILA